LEKKNEKLIFINCYFFTSLSFVESYADCPPGYTQETLNEVNYSYQYPSGGGYFECKVDIVYCCKWDNNLKEVVVEITEVKPHNPDSNCLVYLPDINDFISWLHTVTAQHADKFCSPLFPPCDDNINPFYIFKVFVAGCWYYKNLQLYPHDDIYGTLMRPCPYETTECISTWKVCYDYTYTPAQLTYIFVSKTLSGTSTCPTTMPTLPPAGKTWDEPWESDCFSTGCN